MNHTIAHLREDYKLAEFTEANAFADPMQQFDKWFNEALKAEIKEPNAMVLATSSAENNFPHARVVLLKDVKPEGFTFFTNYQSHKGRELAENPQAALCFNWLDVERQIRIEGVVEKVVLRESDEYFAIRPYKSKIGALASPQSQKIPNRDYLEMRNEQFKIIYPENSDVPRPEQWGGYIVKPLRIEFWQGRRSRLHDRLVFSRTDINSTDWQRARLAP